MNAVTNKVYIANVGNGTTPGNVSVIDGVTDSTSTVTDVNLGPGIDSRGFSIAVNSATNKIYVADEFKNDVSVIDGASNSVTTITDPKAIAPVAVAVDSVTNTIYVANGGCLLLSGCNDPGSVTVIDGATDSFTNLTGSNANAPLAVAVNSVTNTIYPANTVSGNVTVINGSTGTSGVTLSVTIAGNGSGTVTSDPPGIECGFSPLHGNSCSASFASGTSVTLTATPSAPSTFAGWTGDCSGTGSCIRTMNAADSVGATFTSEDFSDQPGVHYSDRGTWRSGSRRDDPDWHKWTLRKRNPTHMYSCRTRTYADLRSLSPAVTLGANAITSTLTITAPGAVAIQLPSGYRRLNRPLYAVLFPFMFGVGVVAASKRQQSRYWPLCGFLALLFFLQTACGAGSMSSGSGTPPPTNYTVTVTGTSGAIQHATQVTVTVQ